MIRALIYTILIMKNIIKDSALFLHKNLIAPISENEDRKRREFILNVIITGSIGLLFILDIFVLYNSLTLDNYHGVRFSSFTGLIFTFLALLYLSRRGYPVVSSYILIGLYFGSITFTSYYWGIELPVLLLSYGLLIVTASILVGTNFGFMVTLLSSGVIIILGYLEISGFDHPQLYWKSTALRLNNAVEFAAILLLMMIISWLSNREIEKSLHRARSSEEALRLERDLLELKVEERTRELKQLQLERISQLYRFAEFGRLASGLFHDLINPLTAVSLYVEQLRKSGDPQVRETRSYVDKAVSLTKRMENFMQGIRKQIQNRDLDMPFILNEEISQVLQILGYKARSAQVELQYIPAQPISSYGNPLKFHQLVSNLVSNAIDACSNIDTTKKLITVTLELQNQFISLRVSDNGSGIAPELREKIFEPFFTTKDPGKGSGIGLSTTKGIVEKDFNGSITVESVSSGGAIFNITIPQKIQL